MTRIDFYQLDGREPKLEFACRLIEGIYRRGHRVYVHTDGIETCRALDLMLWGFKPESFVPHGARRGGAAPESPVELGCDGDCEGHHEVLVNLSGEVPDFFSRFARVGEVVPFEPEARAAARRSYQFYQERGYQLEYHKMSAPGSASAET